MSKETLLGSSSLVGPHSKERIHAEELAERDKTKYLVTLLAQDSFYAFVRLMGPVVVPGFKDGAHIRLICDALQEAYETDNARLMVFLPPGSSKSIIGSLLFPSWIFGKHPEWQILHIAHTFDFIATFGGKIRDLLQTPEYLAIFPHVKLNDKYQAREYWETMQQGVYRCAGAGSAIAGKRGNVGLCGLETNYVKTKDNLVKRLKDLEIGDELLSPAGVEVVTNKVARRHKVCYTINNEVEVSPEHPFKEYGSGKWLEASEVKVGKTKLIVGDTLWTRIVKKCMKFGELLKDVVGF